MESNQKRGGQLDSTRLTDCLTNAETIFFSQCVSEKTLPESNQEETTRQIRFEENSAKPPGWTIKKKSKY